MVIDYDTLNPKQQQTYDFVVKVAGKDPDDPEVAELLGLVGKPKTRIRHEESEKKEAVSREAEAVLLHLRRTDTLIQKTCLQCHLPFATNYVYVGRCSDDCLKASLAELGIEWNPEKTAQERWSGREGVDANSEIPAILRPETVAFLKEWAKVILSWDGDNVRSDVSNNSSPTGPTDIPHNGRERQKNSELEGSGENNEAGQGRNGSSSTETTGGSAVGNRPGPTYIPTVIHTFRLPTGEVLRIAAEPIDEIDWDAI